MLEKKNNLFLTVEFVIETFQQLLLTEVEAIGKSELEELSIASRKRSLWQLSQ